jgi:hypothetical protein
MVIRHTNQAHGNAEHLLCYGIHVAFHDAVQSYPAVMVNVDIYYFKVGCGFNWFIGVLESIIFDN